MDIIVNKMRSLCYLLKKNWVRNEYESGDSLNPPPPPTPLHVDISDSDKRVVQF
jgi:hypothetical protein